MSAIPRNRTKRGSGLPETPSRRRLGAVRRAQLITTYGVGAMVAIENESFVVAGLDDWHLTEEDAPQIIEPRLARMLGVESFRLPPAPDEKVGNGVNVYRFPEWYSCSACDLLAPFGAFNSPRGKSQCGECEEELTPSRFVAACTNGHLTDFPYRAWVHRDPEGIGATCRQDLRLKTSGKTSSLRSVVVSCGCGREASMEGAFRRRALSNLRVRCWGDEPWLGRKGTVDCGEPLRTLQRGSSAAWYPVVRSALSIPPWSEGLYRIVVHHLSKMRGESDEDIATYVRMNKMLHSVPEYNATDVIRLVRAIEEGADEADVGQGWPGILHQEYRKLHSRTPEARGDRQQQFACDSPKEDDKRVRELGVTKTMLVHRLREVRALQSFTRIEGSHDRDDSKRLAPLSRDAASWLPAIEVIGEGVFLDLTGERLAEWERNPDVIARVRIIRENYEKELEEHGGEASDAAFVTPRYVLLHTFAHALIDEWSLDAGYPAAALRERLYVADPDGEGGGMAGVLIYTATSDSAGSLGGVVSQGEPARLADAISAMMKRVEWCSADPLCMESGPAGAGALNLAACHACVLLPETSCSVFPSNSFLDRAVLIGTPDNPSTGYLVST